MRREIQEVEKQIQLCSNQISLIKSKETELEEVIQRSQCEESDEMRRNDREKVIKDQLLHDMKAEIDNLRTIICQQRDFIDDDRFHSQPLGVRHQ